MKVGIGKHSFFRMVAARLAAMGLWKLAVGLIVITGLAGVGAKAPGVIQEFSHHPQPVVTPGGPGQAVTLLKITSLAEFQTRQAQYNFDFTKPIHGSNPFTGEEITAIGSGTIDAYVNFKLTTEVTTPDHNTVLVVLPPAQLSAPYINPDKVKLNETSGMLTHVSHLVTTDSGDGEIAIEAAQQLITAQATADNLTGQAGQGARDFLTQFLKRLGFTKVTVVTA